MQSPSDFFNSVFGLLIWLLDISLVLARLGVEWFKTHADSGLITYLVKSITDSIILILNWVIGASKWLSDTLSKYKT